MWIQNVILILVYLVIFFLLGLNKRIIGPCQMIFLDLSLSHMLILYFEVRLLSSHFYLYFLKLFYLLNLCVLLIISVSLLFFEKTIWNFWSVREWNSDIDILNTLFTFKIYFSLFFLALSVFYVFKIFLSKD